MFARRRKKPLIRRSRDALWPSMGWRRSGLYWRHRIVRMKDSNHKIASGFAHGASVSFTPLPGFHVLSAMALCVVFRANIMAGILGTLVGNPWTIPFMWWLSYRIGKWTFIHFGFEVARMPAHLEWQLLLQGIAQDPMRLFAPWITGGCILTVLSWPFFYVASRFIISSMRRSGPVWRVGTIRQNGNAVPDTLQ